MARNHNRVRILMAPYVHAGGVAITVGQADPRPPVELRGNRPAPREKAGNK
jgi:hypothetical protein